MTAKQTPLLDLLRSVPADARLSYEHSPIEYSMIPVGRLAAEAADEIERLCRALHEVAEEWAGAECGEPVHAQEAYAIELARRMYGLAADALRGLKP